MTDMRLVEALLKIADAINKLADEVGELATAPLTGETIGRDVASALEEIKDALLE